LTLGFESHWINVQVRHVQCCVNSIIKMKISKLCMRILIKKITVFYGPDFIENQCEILM
jgi:hypothetical protein